MSQTNQLVPARVSFGTLPALVVAGGEQAAERFFEFFTSNIRNRHTWEAYGRAVNGFLRWCEAHGARSLTEVKSLHADLECHRLDERPQRRLGRTRAA